MVQVKLPPGWIKAKGGIPDLSFPTPEELARGYKAEGWWAAKDQWRVEVHWRGNQGVYFCRLVHGGDTENPHESHSFPYPHEVVDWLQKCFAQLAPS